jgi:hypothetical protein
LPLIRQALRRAKDALARDTDHPAGSFEAENSGGLLSGFLAEEDEFDRRALWRLGSWGAGAVAAVIVAVLANQTSFGWRRDQVAAADLTRQAQQIQVVARESQNEARRLASAVDTLNGDRDRLYSRVTVLEQGLDSVTGAIVRQNPAAPAPPAALAPSAAATPPSAAQNPTPAPAVIAVATTEPAATSAEKPAAATPEPTSVASAGQSAPSAPAPTPATPLMASKSIMDPPDPAAGKLIEPGKPASAVTATPIPEIVASAPSGNDAEADEATTPKAAIQRTEFGVDLGSANSVGGLRALWRGLLKSKSNAPLAALRPIIVVKEGAGGFGMQLRLVAGPLNDAGAAARICAILTENQRGCDTAIFDGQRLSMKTDDPPPAPIAKPVARRRSAAKRTAVEDAPRKPETSTISSLFGRKGNQGQ